MVNISIFQKNKELPIYPLTADRQYRQEHVFRDKGALFHQIFLVNKGEGVLNVGGKVLDLQAGDMFFLKKNYCHEYWGDEDFTTTYLSFDGYFCDRLFEHYGITDNFGVYKNRFSKRVYENIVELCVENADSYIQGPKAQLTVSLFFEEVSNIEQTPIQKVKRYLELNFDKEISLDDILSFYPYSKTKLCKDFLKEYSMTVFDMITKLRLKYAKLIITNDPYVKLKEVAAKCGYNDVSYFCKMYKKAYNKSPKAQL